MFVRWNDRPMPSRQTSWGDTPVMSRPSSSTAPASGRTWPVMRLKNVVFPAPFGPMMAAIWPGATVRLTPPTARNPSKAFRMSRTSSTVRAPDAPRQQLHGAGQAAGEDEEQDDQDAAEHERPVLRVRGDLLVEEDQRQRADCGTVKRPHTAEQGHDQHLGRLRPVREVGEDAAIEDAEQSARQPGEGAGQDEGGQLVAPDVDADEFRALGVLADRGEHAAERRARDPPQRPQAQRYQDEREEVKVLGRAPAADERHGR